MGQGRQLSKDIQDISLFWSYGRRYYLFYRTIESGLKVFSAFFCCIEARAEVPEKSTILGLICKDLGMKTPDQFV